MPTNREVNRDLGLYLLEANALRKTFRALNGSHADHDAAIIALRPVFLAWRVRDFSSRVTLLAMAKILGVDLHPFAQHLPLSSVKNPWEKHYFETLSYAWALWALDPSSTGPLPLLFNMAQERSEQKTKSTQTRNHLAALDPWRVALEHLVRRENLEARTSWDNAIEIGSTYPGNTNHPVIQWTYAASFFSF